MEYYEIEKATQKIREFIDNFDYDTELDKLLSDEFLITAYNQSNNNYEKLQIYRIIKNENNSNDIIKKFVNETYHIDNDYFISIKPI